ncbi:hypothetical protein D9Q98_009630 [Chlorella vulgaris]|uniref:MI domain-containing protein n=1 Tax=Chlorella vulgaris TaxID=3077 RepID=A0A9D4TFM1_CHLVU|nr:hypothetical protein D9Q98_009630 [Chlorella vulgaris]
MQAPQPPQQPGGRGKPAGGRGSGRGPHSQINKKGPESHPLPNGTSSPPSEPAAPSAGGMSWAARLAISTAKPTPPTTNGSAADGPPAAPAVPTAPAPAVAAVPAASPAQPAVQPPATTGVKLPPGVEGRQPSIKFGDIDPSEMAKEQAAAPAPKTAAVVPPPARPTPSAAPSAPAPPAVAQQQQQQQQQPVAAAPLPVVPASASTQKPSSFAAAAATGGPAKPAAGPGAMGPPHGMPQQMQQAGRQQHSSGPRGGQARGPSGQQPGVGMNPAMGMYPQQYYHSMPAQSNMNPGAASFGQGGVMFMPGGASYFQPSGNYQHQQPWQAGPGYGGAQYMNSGAMQANNMQPGMPSSVGLGAGPQQHQQQQMQQAPYAVPGGGGAPKPAPVATPPRTKKILRLENPDTHEAIDLSKVKPAGAQPTGTPAAKAADGSKPAAPALKAPAAADAKKPEAPKTAPEAAKSVGPSKAAAEAAAVAALKPKAEASPAEAGSPATAAAEEPATTSAAPIPAAAPVTPSSLPAAVAPPQEPAAAPAAPAPPAAPAAAAAPKPAAVWGGGKSFKEKLLVDPAEKKRQDEEAARKRAAEEEAARKKAADEAAARQAEEDAKRKAEEEKQAAIKKQAEKEEAARKAAEEKRKVEEEEAAAKKADEEAAAKKKADEAAAAAATATAAAAATALAAKSAAKAEADAAEKQQADDKAAATAKQQADDKAAATAKQQADEQAAIAQKAEEEQQKAAAAPAASPAEAPPAEAASDDAGSKQGAAPTAATPLGGASPFDAALEEGELPEQQPQEEEQEEEAEPPTGFESDTSGRKRYSLDFLFYYGNRCNDVPKDIEAETFKQLSRENFPPMGGPPMGGGRGPRGGGGPGGNFGGDERWQSGRLPSGPVPGGPPGMRGGDPRMMGRQPSGRQPRGGVEADQWERGKPLPPMPGMQQQYDNRRGGPPPGMAMGGRGGAMAQLHKTGNAYKVGATLTDDPAEEAAQKQLKSLLNKITKDNFAKITAQMIDVINERKLAQTLSGFINQIFDKALTETHFAELYADLVAALSPALPLLKDEEGNDVQFRRTLLNKCQVEFEAGVTAMKAVSEREKLRKETGAAEDGQEEDEEEEEKDDEEKEEEVDERGEEEIKQDEAKAKHDAEVAAKKADLAARKEERRKAMAELQARKRMLGNIVFVGQMYKKGVVTETVMHTCIKQLLDEVANPRPEDVECMCKLLVTGGGLLDSSTKTVKNFNNGKPAPTKEVMTVYFNRIEQLSRNEEALDSRHRFMLVDLIEQRRNRWRPRKEVEGPKTIEEIHREEAMKRSRSAMLDRQGGGGGSFRGQRGGPPPARAPFDNRVDAPIRAMNRSGSNDVLGTSGQQSFRPGGRPGPPRAGDARPGPLERQSSARQQGPQAAPARSERVSAPKAAAALKAEEKSEAGSEQSEGEEQPAASPASGLSDEEMRAKLKLFLSELYNAKDVKDGAACIKDLVDRGADVAALFEGVVNSSLEGKGTDWDVLGAVLGAACEEGVLQSTVLDGCARRLLDNLDDLAVDVPKAPVQIGSVLGALVAAGGLDLKSVAEHIRTADATPDELEEGEDTMLVGGGGAIKTLGSLWQKLVERKGEEAAKEAWQATGEQLKAFMPQQDRSNDDLVQSTAEKLGLLSLL